VSVPDWCVWITDEERYSDLPQQEEGEVHENQESYSAAAQSTLGDDAPPPTGGYSAVHFSFDSTSSSASGGAAQGTSTGGSSIGQNAESQQVVALAFTLYSAKMFCEKCTITDNTTSCTSFSSLASHLACCEACK
jgi:hypothetical protein